MKKYIISLIVPLTILIVIMVYTAVSVYGELDTIKNRIEKIENEKEEKEICKTCEMCISYKPVEYSKLDTVGKIRYKAENAGLDPDLVEAISRVETGHFTSNAFLNYNNFGGLTTSKGVMEFGSFEEGLEAYINTLVWYKEDGLTTIKEISERYCPVNKENWSYIVTSIYNDLRKGE